MNTLNNIDFDEWINIPKPLIQTLILFKQCFLEQSRKTADCYAEIENSNNKVQIKLRTMNESLANTNDSIRYHQETILKKVKERCEFLSNDISQFKKKIQEENNNKQKVLNENLYDMKEQVNRCVKAVGNIVDLDEINQLLNERSIIIHQNVFNDVRDQQLQPALGRIMQELKILNDKHTRAIENVNNTIKTTESNSQDEQQKTSNNISELRTHVIEKDHEIGEYMKKTDREIVILRKQIELLQQSFIESEKDNSRNFFDVKNEVAQTIENYFTLVKKIESFENGQNTRSRTVAPIMITNPQSKEEYQRKITFEAHDVLSQNTQHIENELKSYKFKTELELKFLKSELLKTIKDQISPLEEKIVKSQLQLESTTLELRDKLSWLPININDLNGMTPSDARLFTIEARLRAEENSRIQSLCHIEKSLDSIKKTSLSPILLKTSDRRATPDPTLETLHSISEFEEIKLPLPDNTIYTSLPSKNFPRKHNKSVEISKSNRTISLHRAPKHKHYKS